MTAGPHEPPVLEVRDLAIGLGRHAGAPRIVHGIDLSLHRGRTLALVGESGCGKSVTAQALINLLSPPLAVLGGSIRYAGEGGGVDIAALAPASDAMRALRGRRIAMIFQDPMTALDPVYPVGEQIAEALRHHLGMTARAAAARAIDLLRLVGIPDPAARARAYPFQLSGGMRQRVVIAIALACEPSVLIADEPTTALDVTVQAQILAELRSLGERFGTAMLLITHDLGVVAEVADDVAIMYRGHVVERAGVESLFAAPSHPYTRGLLASLPPVDGERRSLTPIPGQVPPVAVAIDGCPFADRCVDARPDCRAALPPAIEVAPGHVVACVLHARDRSSP
ncbi:MAG: ABC transporter ATP-binding protein [Alphaproteobacteria bacterium]|nr:ABC transporter ATP-binding protein [Alphaproteobacteria bacterium]